MTYTKRWQCSLTLAPLSSRTSASVDGNTKGSFYVFEMNHAGCVILTNLLMAQVHQASLTSLISVILKLLYRPICEFAGG